MGLFLASAMVPQVGAQQIVYEMEFERERGFNDQGFSGGYFVAPIGGGQGTFVLTTGRGGALEVVVISDGAKLFRAVTEKKEVRWVVQAQVGGATAPTEPTQPPLDDDDEPSPGNNVPTASTGAFLAVGKGDYTATFRTPLVTIETVIGRELKGEVISASSAALDENFKNVGFVSMSKWRLKWAEKETNEVNKRGLELAGASAYLVSLFERDAGNGGPPVIIAAPTIVTTSLPTGVAGVAYTAQLNAVGGSPPLSWTASGLPAGLSIVGNTIFGTPSVSGSSVVTVTVRDSRNPARTSSIGLTLAVFLNILPANTVLPEGTVAAPYTPVIFTAAGAVGVVTFTAASGTNLPLGMTFVNGTLSGTPTEAGDFTLVVSATDAGTTLEPRTKIYTLKIIP